MIIVKISGFCVFSRFFAIIASLTGKYNIFIEGIQGNLNNFIQIVLGAVSVRLKRLTATEIQRAMQGFIDEHEDVEVETEEDIPIDQLSESEDGHASEYESEEDDAEYEENDQSKPSWS